MGPTMFIPLVARERAFGTLSVANPIGAHVFTESEIDLVEAFAEQASVAVELGEALSAATAPDADGGPRADRQGAARRRDPVAVRRRHGTPGDGDARRGRGPRPAIEGGVEELDRVIKDLRSYIFGLRPDILAGGRLDDALRQLGRRVRRADRGRHRRRGGCTRRGVLAGQGDRRRPARPRGAVERGSSRGRRDRAVSLLIEDTGPVLVVDDDGRGFDVRRRRRPGRACATCASGRRGSGRPWT